MSLLIATSRSIAYYSADAFTLGRAISSSRCAGNRSNAAGLVNRQYIVSSEGSRSSRFALDAHTPAEIARIEKLKIKGLVDPDKKPRNSPAIEKWYGKGGTIEVLPNGNWKYTDWERKPNSVVYEDGFPNFTDYVRQEVNIEMKGNHKSDYDDANNSAEYGKKLDDNTWHHHQNGETMQEVPRAIHSRFTHLGGCSTIKERRLAESASGELADNQSHSKINKKKR